MRPPQKALELILARNFLSSVSTPAFLVDGDGEICFFNEAAGALLGRRFEETGNLPASEWTAMFGPYDKSGTAIPWNELPVTAALRRDRPAHAQFCIKAGGKLVEIEVSGLPIVGSGDFKGALVLFWVVPDGTEETA